jgi:addiction module RelE/StbE family toxin
MDRIVWSPQAAADLETIFKYIAREAPRYARVFAAESLAAVERAAECPRAGRVVPEFDTESLRERIVGRYRVIYRTDQGVAEVVTILHGSRLLRDTEGHD